MWLIPFSFWVTLAACVLGFWAVWREHNVALAARNSASDSSERRKHEITLSLLWIIPVLVLIGTISNGYEALKASQAARAESLTLASTQEQLHETRMALEDAETRLDPNNQRIATLTASASIELRGPLEIHKRVSGDGTPAYALMYIGSTDKVESNVWDFHLTATRSQVYRGGSETERVSWFMHFEMQLTSPFGYAGDVTVNQVKHLDQFLIRFSGIFQPIEVLGGSVELIMNDSVRRKVDIPAQTQTHGVIAWYSREYLRQPE